ncbi:MAG: hypothetical protein SOZ96_14105 [Treponema sp.]|nr:hypothetical protein [Treponema sp.]
MESEEQNFSFVGDSLNESLIKSLNAGNGFTTPKVDVSKFIISDKGEVLPNNGATVNNTVNSNKSD